jgi:hypothetical protein
MIRWGAALAAAMISTAAAQDTSTGVARALESDRLEVNGLRVRLHGVIGPALSDPGGVEGQELLQRLIDSHVIVCHLLARQRNGLRVAGCEIRGRDIGALAVEAGAVRDCPAESRGRYSTQERNAPADSPARRMTLPNECRLSR